MQSNKNFLPGVLLSSTLLLFFTLGITGNFFSQTFTNTKQEASVINSRKVQNIYNISPSKQFPGAFNFSYQFEKTRPSSKEANFDLPIAPFDETKAGEFTDFGPIRDAWGYPVKENAFMKQEEPKKQSFLNSLKTNKAVAYDEDTSNPGVYNCRANTSVTGYFKAYFEDVALNTNVGFDDPSFGDGRREEACQVLEDMSELLMIDTTTVTPDILFTRSDQPLPPGALAAASSYFGYYMTGPDNGSLHKHIISRQDPTPTQGSFDAFVITNWSGINWSVDSSLNENTYDFYTVMWHEIMHTLGFRGLMPATIPQTSIPEIHGTFDFFSYKDQSLQDRFITAITNLLNVPVGAPSPWFITNQVVYRGVKNILNATPDGIRPIYSPTNWQQGSSLSHFDMGRANGEEYVMHPSIGTNTEREIHEHEKEVLCHLGYQVEGLEECEDPTPVAQSNTVTLNESNDPVCIDYPLLNDYSFNGFSLDTLIIYDVNLINIQAGDYIEYFSNHDCTGISLSQNPNGSRSVLFMSSSNTPSRQLEYRVQDIVSQRISHPATIYIRESLPACSQITSDPYEHICNGEFDASIPSDSSDSYASIMCYPSWGVPSLFNGYEGESLNVCGYSPDIIFYDVNQPMTSSDYFSSHSSPAPIGTDFPYIRAGLSQTGSEMIIMGITQPLIPGEEYILSFDATVHLLAPQPSLTSLEVNLVPGAPILPPVPVGQSIFYESIPINDSQWYSFSQNFIPNDTYESIQIRASNDNTIQVYPFNWVMFDNISIRSIDAPVTPTYSGSISGHLYHDQNQNSSHDSLTEPRLSGIPVGLFQAGNSTPIQTTTTEDIPNLGKYQFTNLPDGQYYIGLIGENLYQSVTEPGVSTDPFANYNHMQTGILEDGQAIQNLDFGVTLQSGVPQTTNITIKKDLIDSSLSIFDRFVTWRIRVFNSGPSVATTINISDFLPAGITYFSYNNQNELETYSPNSGIYYIPELSPGEATYIDITTKVPIKTCGAKVNTASLQSMDQTDVSSVDNQAYATLNLKPCFPTALEGRF